MPEEKLPTFGVLFYEYMSDGAWFRILEPLDRLKVVTIRNKATYAGRSVMADELNGLYDVLFEGRALEGMIGFGGCPLIGVRSTHFPHF